MTAFSDADREKLLAAGAEQVDEWVKLATEEGLDGAALLADYQQRIDAYSAELAEKGYPWNR